MDKFRSLIGIAKHSGCDIRITLNPFQWAYVPDWRFGAAMADEAFLYSDIFRELHIRFLCVSLTAWIDGDIDDPLCHI